MYRITSIALAVSLCVFGSAGNAGAVTISYQLLIDGVHVSDSYTGLPGTHTLGIQVKVDGAGQDAYGRNLGLAQAYFNLMDSTGIPGNLTFARQILSGTPGNWASWIAPGVTGLVQYRGYLNARDYDVYAQVVAVPPSNYADSPSVGAGVWQTICSGDFTWDGGECVLSLVPGPATGQLYIKYDATADLYSSKGAMPDVLVGDSVHFVPEPATLCLLALGGIGLLGRRRPFSVTTRLLRPAGINSTKGKAVMIRTTLIALVASLCIFASAGSARAVTISYQLLIDGVQVSDSYTGLPGTHTLSVQVKVDGAGQDAYGKNLGLAAACFNLEDSTGIPGDLAFARQAGSGTPGTWASWAAPDVTNLVLYRGALDWGSRPSDVNNQAAAIPLTNYSDNPSIGAGAWQTICSGNFTWNGGECILELVPGPIDKHLYLTYDAATDSYRSAAPDSLVGDTVLFIPEPATLGLLIVGGAAMICRRRRRR